MAAPSDSNNNDIGFVAEPAWNDVSGATGGGASSIFPKPSYQTGLGVPADGARDVPDIALAASPNTPGYYFVNSQNALAIEGGTSFAAPIWAGIAKLIDQMSGARVVISRPESTNWVRSGLPPACAMS